MRRVNGSGTDTLLCEGIGVVRFGTIALASPELEPNNWVIWESLTETAEEMKVARPLP